MCLILTVGIHDILSPKRGQFHLDKGPNPSLEYFGASSLDRLDFILIPVCADRVSPVGRRAYSEDPWHDDQC